jgi:hypothetical protein
MRELEILTSESTICTVVRALNPSDSAVEEDTGAPNRVTTVPPLRARHLSLVRTDDCFSTETGLYEAPLQDGGESSRAAARRYMGSLLLSAVGLNNPLILRNRVVAVLEREFGCAIESIRSGQWEAVLSALELIGGESAMFEDVVQLLIVISELNAPLHLRTALKLKASHYLETHMGNWEASLSVALDAQELAPFSAEITLLICMKICRLEAGPDSEKSAAYWKRFISLYIDMLSEHPHDRDKRIGALLMLSRIFCEGLKDEKAGRQCLERARILDPESPAVVERLVELAGR